MKRALRLVIKVFLDLVGDALGGVGSSSTFFDCSLCDLPGGSKKCMSIDGTGT